MAPMLITIAGVSLIYLLSGWLKAGSRLVFCAGAVMALWGVGILWSGRLVQRHGVGAPLEGNAALLGGFVFLSIGVVLLRKGLRSPSE